MKLKKLQETYKEMRSRERRNLQQLDAEGANAYAKKELGEDHYWKQYRSNLSKVIGFFEDLPLTLAHVACLRTTPFYNFLQPFIEKKVTTKSVTGTQKGLVKILLTYDRNNKAFVMGGQKLAMTAREVELVFGIMSGKKEIDICQSPICESEFGRRKFPGYKKVTGLDIRAEIEECVYGTSRQDIEDTVRLIVLHIVGCVLFVANADMARGWMFKLCDNIAELREYNWGAAVTAYLSNYLNSKGAKDVRGCTVFLQYWFCERTTTMQPTKKDAFPRFLKWDLSQLHTVMENLTVKDLAAGQVRGRPLTPTQFELDALSPTRMYEPRKSGASRKTNLPNQTKSKSPTKSKVLGDVAEPEAGFTTPVVERHYASDFELDDVPIAKLDFSNISVHKTSESVEKSNIISSKSVGKGKAVMSYAHELEEREKKLQSAEKILQRREHAVEIRLAKLDERMQEVANENERLKRLCADQSEIIKKLEIERDNASANDAIRVLAIDELNNQLKELQRKLNEATKSGTEDSVAHEGIPDQVDKGKSIVMYSEPSLSIGLTQMGMDDSDGYSIEPVEETEKEKPVPISMIAKRTRSYQEEVSPPPKSALGKIGKNLAKYGPFKELSFDTQVSVEFLASRKDLNGCILWWDKVRQIRVKHNDIFACIQRQCLSNDVLDAYSRIKRIDQDAGVFKAPTSNEQRGTTHVFDSLLLNEIRMSETGTFIPPSDFGRHRHLVFPIIHKQNNAKRGVDHWTVLIIDTEKGDIRFFNSLRPRAGRKHPYLEDAKEVLAAIRRTANQYGIPLPYDEPIIIDENAPQQSSTSVDCGVAVLYVISSYYEQQPVTKMVGESGFVTMRARIVETLMTWGDKRDYFVDQLQKKRRITK